MVLTRRAYKSIVRWLPNEMLSEVFGHLFGADLLALCRTSRLINGLATPLLYRSIALSEISAMEKFVFALRKHADSSMPLSRHVREFWVGISDCSAMYAALVDQISVAISSCPYLHTLTVLMPSTPLCDMLREANFPNLHVLHYAVAPDIASALPAFINRHQTITTLGMVWNGDHKEDFYLDPIRLINLESYLGDTFFPTSPHLRQDSSDHLYLFS
ncbi:hypothetical protein MVEN_01134500 [Mycena venus]|uniref:F-box domain-containing protein n=1 Tax=Mycena venus TaxID=2733690 RepID=A0A8H6Y9V1_9AGAR|nr:hypothetical protein MVEN_01134500 [Mycena venus]